MSSHFVGMHLEELIEALLVPLEYRGIEADYS